jgi:8-oxo-dGTP pyrophosphatase MutT (NUDIX family)
MTGGYAAGILPLMWKDEKTPIFLVGKDVRDGLYSDFGGKMERSDRKNGMMCTLLTACRECYEETYGVLGSIKQLLSRMKNQKDYICLRATTQNNLDYYMYIVELPYIQNIQSHFRKTLQFVQQANSQKVFIEKTDICYVTCEQLKHIPKRPGFKSTIQTHQHYFDIIASSDVHSWRADIPPPPILRPVHNKPKFFKT